MPDIRTIAQRLVDERANAWEEAKALLDAAEAESRDLSGEEQAAYDEINTKIEANDARVAALLATEKREIEAAERRTELEKLIGSAGDDKTDRTDPTKQVEDELRSFLRGERRSFEAQPVGQMPLDLRDLSKLSAGAGANLVKTGFYEQLVAHLIEVSGLMQAGPTVLTTATGEQIQVPKTTAHGTGALVAEADAIAESDPTFGQAALDAYKYGILIQVSSELVTDTSVDLLGYLSMQAGRAIGNAFGVDAVVGDGSSKPQGVIPAASAGVTGGTGVTGVFTGDNLIDLFYSVIAPYRASASCGWLMRDATVAKVRKLKDSNGQYLWQPSLVAGTPSLFLDKPVHTDPNVVATGLSAKSVAFGDFSQYFVRMVQGIRFERSDDYAFANDLVTFRCLLRADGELVDRTGAIKVFTGGAS